MHIIIILGGFCSLVLAMGLSRFGYTPMIALMNRDLNISDSMTGIIASSNYAGYLIGAFLASFIYKAKHKKIIINISIIINLATICAMALTTNPIVWSIYRFFSGLTTAFIFVLCSSIVMTSLNKIEKQQYAGFLYAGVGIGIALTGLLVPLFDKIYAWRAGWLGLFATGLIFGIIALIILSRVKVEDTIKSTTNAKKPKGWLNILITYGLEGFSYVIMSTFLVKIVESIPATSHLSMSSWVIVGLAAAPSTMIWAFLGKNIGLNKALLISYIMQILSMLLPIISPNAFGTILSAVLFGGTFMGIVTLSISTANKLMPKDNTKAIGQLTSVYAFAQMIGPSVAGIISQKTAGYHTALIIASIVLGLAVVVFIINEVKNIKEVRKCRT